MDHNQSILTSYRPSERSARRKYRPRIWRYGTVRRGLYGQNRGRYFPPDRARSSKYTLSYRAHCWKSMCTDIRTSAPSDDALTQLRTWRQNRLQLWSRFKDTTTRQWNVCFQKFEGHHFSAGFVWNLTVYRCHHWESRQEHYGGKPEMSQSRETCPSDDTGNNWVVSRRMVGCDYFFPIVQIWLRCRLPTPLYVNKGPCSLFLRFWYWKS